MVLTPTGPFALKTWIPFRTEIHHLAGSFRRCERDESIELAARSSRSKARDAGERPDQYRARSALFDSLLIAFLFGVAVARRR